MKRFLFLFGVIFLSGLHASSQDTSMARLYKGFEQAVALGINCPLGDLADTHSFGFGARYIFIPPTIKKLKDWKSKPTHLLIEADLDYFFGKTDAYNYKNKGYIIFQALAGILYQPGTKSFYCLSAGAALDRYGNKTSLGFGTHLNGNFYVKNNIAISPGLRFIKFKEANGWWIATVAAAYTF